MTLKNPGPSFDQPLEMLAACHERMAVQLGTLTRLPEHLEKHGCDAEAKAAAQAVMRYFDTAGRLHHQDEDEDLFPLLRRRAAAAARPEVAGAIDELEREHDSMELQWQRLRAHLAAVAEGAARLDPEEIGRFCWLYGRHLETEAAAVLPFAREALGEEDLTALGRRMAQRRG